MRTQPAVYNINTISDLRKVSDDGAARPSRVEIKEFSLTRPKTGEESAFDLNDDGEIGDGSLGLTSKERIQKMIAGLNGKELFEDPDFPACPKSLFYSAR